MPTKAQSIEANKQLKIIYEDKQIMNCELRLPGCWINNALGFCHLHKRQWYDTRIELLGSFNQTLLGCNSCHSKIEYDKELTEETFKRLRL